MLGISTPNLQEENGYAALSSCCHDGMIEQNEQNDGEVLPVERRMPMHRHHLGKNERPARKNRKK